MPENKNRDASWDTDFMMSNAKSLQRVVKELEKNDASKSPQADPLLFSGVFLASPILLLLAIELALKTWQCKERQGKHDPIHDLLKLFDSLKPETRELLEEGMRAVEPYSMEHLFDGMRSWEPLRSLLSCHKDVFIKWRYMNEYGGRVVQTASLDRALTVIIDSYDKRWGDSRWGS